MYVYDENTENDNPSDISINMVNKTAAELSGGGDLSGVNWIYFDFSDVQIQQATYTILDYDIKNDFSVIGGSQIGGNQILSNSTEDTSLEASNKTVTINGITSSTINLSFTFTRNDGQIISGHYSGSYITH